MALGRVDQRDFLVHSRKALTSLDASRRAMARLGLVAVLADPEFWRRVPPLICNLPGHYAMRMFTELDVR